MGRKKTNPKSAEEKKRYEREKKRKQRAKMTDEQKELKKERDREYKKKRKENNTWKTVETMSDRELRKVRKQTKLRVRKFRERKAAEARLTHLINQTTPPQSPHENQNPVYRVASSRQHCGRKKKNLNRSRVYRTLKATQLALNKARTRAEKFKKQAQRLRERLKEKCSPSPNSKVKKLAGGRIVPSPVKRRLAFAEVVLSQLENKKKAMCMRREKDEFNLLVASPSLKKYKLIQEASFLLSYKAYRRALMRQNCKPIKRNNEHATLVKLFLEEDINSRMCPGKKDTRTMKKDKKQKRVLLDTMKNLHGKFLKSLPGLNISYSKFCSLKPFYIVQPKSSDRETCACIKHVNAQFVVDKLYQLNVLYTNSINKILEDSCCSIQSKLCMYRKCKDCSRMLEFDLKGNENFKVTFKQWIQKNEPRVIKGKDVIVKITEKVQKECLIKELVENLVTRLHDIGPHIYQIHHHYKVMKNLRESMGSNEVMIHMDFSENYVIKHAEEVQSMHFGASKKQISLHTVVCYNVKLGNKKSVESSTTEGVQSFATISSNLDHQAHGVWAHLEPIIKHLRESLPEVDTVHFRSDGPSSQYKNKSNVFFLNQSFPSLWPEITRWTWNFSISGHGKGPMDGICGTIKRTADAMVLRGHDIKNTTDLIKMAESNCKKIKVIEVENHKVHEWKYLLSQKLQKIPGIFKVHQILWTKDQPNNIQLRELPCSECMFQLCPHHPVGKMKYFKLSNVTDNHPSRDTDVSDKRNVTTNDVTNASIGSYVAVIYDTTWFPGDVMEIKEGEATIKFMARNGKNFQWPAKPDVQTVKIDSILCIINEIPYPVSSRNFIFKCTEYVDKQCSVELDD